MVPASSIAIGVYAASHFVRTKSSGLYLKTSPIPTRTFLCVPSWNRIGL